jgi:hypothetical protein
MERSVGLAWGMACLVGCALIVRLVLPEVRLQPDDDAPKAGRSRRADRGGPIVDDPGRSRRSRSSMTAPGRGGIACPPWPLLCWSGRLCSRHDEAEVESCRGKS